MSTQSSVHFYLNWVRIEEVNSALGATAPERWRWIRGSWPLGSLPLGSLLSARRIDEWSARVTKGPRFAARGPSSYLVGASRSRIA